MLPKTEFELNELEFKNNLESYTSWEILPNGRIGGKIYDKDVLTQQIYMLLNTERYSTPIFSYDYGVEIVELIGKNMADVKMLIGERLEEACLQHELVEQANVTKIEQIDKNSLHIDLTLETVYGKINIDKEVIL